jgi:hypothetical protein
LSLEALLNSAQQASGATATKGTMQPASPTGVNLQKLLEATKPKQAPLPQVQPVQGIRPNAHRGIPQMPSREATVAKTGLKTPTMSTQMRQQMMGRRNA